MASSSAWTKGAVELRLFTFAVNCPQPEYWRQGTLGALCELLATAANGPSHPETPMFEGRSCP